MIDRSKEWINFKALIRLIRPTHWIKNGFVLAPLIFAGKFTEPEAVFDALGALFFFSLAASAVYVLNDYMDIENDRRHPVKSRKRPLASGDVSKPQALVLLALLYGALIWGSFWRLPVMAVVFGYVVLNVAYTAFLKHRPVIDIFIIALGFVLRIFAGAQALAVEVSSWMFVTTLCLGLFLASLKRRQELVRQGIGGRSVLGHYSVDLMNRYSEISMTGTLIFYALFVVTESSSLVVTVPFVLYGLFRYWFLIESRGEESPTDVLLSDWQLCLTVLAWVGLCMGLLR